jgi:hypothetical protein
MRAWTTDPVGEEEHISTAPIVSVGEPVVIEPFEEIHVLRWARVGRGKALVLWRDSLYLVDEDDLQDRTLFRGFVASVKAK